MCRVVKVEGIVNRFYLQFDSLRPQDILTGNMKHRIITGWSIQRVVLLLSGAFILVVAITAKEPLAGLIGVFLTAMGILGYKRGAGNCYGGSCKPYGSEGDSSCCKS